MRIIAPIPKISTTTKNYNKKSFLCCGCLCCCFLCCGHNLCCRLCCGHHQFSCLICCCCFRCWCVCHWALLSTSLVSASTSSSTSSSVKKSPFHTVHNPGDELTSDDLVCPEHIHHLKPPHHKQAILEGRLGITSSDSFLLHTDKLPHYTLICHLFCHFHSKAFNGSICCFLLPFLFLAPTAVRPPPFVCSSCVLLLCAPS